MARTRTSISVHRLALGHCDLTRKISGEVTTKILYRDLLARLPALSLSLSPYSHVATPSLALSNGARNEQMYVLQCARFLCA